MTILYYKNRMWQTVNFDIDNGIGHVRWFKNNPNVCSGWAYKKNLKWYSVWSNGSSLFFQTGKIKIPITDEYICTFRLLKKTFLFQIAKGDKIVFSKKILKPFLLTKIDITYDDFDFELDNFFYWLYNLWNDVKWRNEVISNLNPVSEIE